MTLQKVSFTNNSIGGLVVVTIVILLKFVIDWTGALIEIGLLNCPIAECPINKLSDNRLGG